MAAYQEHGTWNMKEVFPDDWGSYRRYEIGQAYRKAPHQQPTKLNINIPGFPTPTMKHELWATTIESHFPEGSDGPEVTPGFHTEALPYYVEGIHSRVRDAETYEEYPILCITGRRIPVYFHSEHRQLPWCRELWPVPRMEINPETAAELGLEQGDWAWIESPWGKVRQTVDLYYGIAPGTINCEHQWWYPELAQADKGFKLSCINCIVDRTAQGELPQCVSQCCGMARWYGDAEAGIESFEGPRGEKLGDFVNDFTEDQVYQLTDVGNGPSMFYIMRNIKWQGVE